MIQNRFPALAVAFFLALVAGCRGGPELPPLESLQSVLDFPQPVPAPLVDHFVAVAHKEKNIQQSYWAARGPAIRRRLPALLADPSPRVVAAALALGRDRLLDGELGRAGLELMASPAPIVRREATLLAHRYFVQSTMGASPDDPDASARIFWNRSLELLERDLTHLLSLSGLPATRITPASWIRLYNRVLEALGGERVPEAAAVGAAAFAGDLLFARLPGEPRLVGRRLAWLGECLRREQRPRVGLVLLAIIGRMSACLGTVEQPEWPDDIGFYFQREWPLAASAPADFPFDPDRHVRAYLDDLWTRLVEDDEPDPAALLEFNNLGRSVFADYFGDRAREALDSAPPDLALLSRLAEAGLITFWQERLAAP